ncbi:MAG: glycoside hydrolase family 3 C-terminal domain-containing protein [Bacteroidetes bacterium]|nr:glycoside hydrolase family 3 C-terminal domain-containing protein [Bacteroidota bacterium]MBU1116442.1 glycoside hydrolase family 3 C-terminal domain-containing protein [Bacteroidota bacterium]MBU1800021.1 glycoside hydrolase family 3 C-terminal domain-containing protein [Bacteroidota bacterium]
MKDFLKYFLVILFPSFLFAQEDIPFRNVELPLEQRINDLVGSLTLEEKASQMVYNSPAIERLGIPAYNWWNEGLHGIARNGIATVFPQAIGLAATWDTDLIFKVATVISDEARAKYNQAISRNQHGIYQGLTIWSPNVNIFRDPRWGRGMETYGEDPYLTGEIAVQFIKGLQGNDPKYLKTIATPKHIAVHSGPEPLRHTFNAVVSEYDLRETYLAQFKKCVLEGNAYSLMCAYNRFRGEACCGSDLLLKKILRDEWGFSGIIVSDCWAIPDMYNYHKIVETAEEASAITVKAGTDLECGNAYASLLNALDQGLLNEDEIDASVKNVFKARFKLGMFDPDENVPYSKLTEFDTEANKKLALETSRKSMVLLKNENNTLPLKKDLKTIAVIGPNANDIEVLLGNYNGFPSNPITPLQGIRNKLSNSKVIYERGCELAEGMPSFNIISSEFLFTNKELNENGLNAEYYNNSKFSGEPLHKRVDSNIDFGWWDAAPFDEFDPDDYAVVWTGYLVPKETGKYTLGGYGFNGFKIYLDDSLFVQFDGEFDPVKTYKDIELEKGKPYKIKMEFYKNLRYSFVQLIWSAPDNSLEQRAIEASKEADAVILCMGLSPRIEGEEMKVAIKGFAGGDRETLQLPETQREFIKKIQKLGKPIVLVLLNGSALAVNWENENIPAIIEAWYPGQSGGEAIADIIFGDYNPAGRLPVTFYKSVEQLPEFDDYDMKNRTYRYFNGEPLYPFGFGLSYSTFEYSDLKLAKYSIKSIDSTYISVNISNTGKIGGEEVAQLYIKADNDKKTVKTLKGFKRIYLQPGETKTVEFKINKEVLNRWIDNTGFSVEKDSYKIMVGTSSSNNDLFSCTLHVVE